MISERHLKRSSYVSLTSDQQYESEQMAHFNDILRYIAFVYKKTFKDAQSVYEYVEKHYDTLPDVIIPYETLTDFKNAIDHGIFDWYFEMYITADDYKVWDAAIREGKASI